MENIKNNLEQPFFNNSHSEEVSQTKNGLLDNIEDKNKMHQNFNNENLSDKASKQEVENRAEFDTKNGSKYGKFKDAETLFEAYNNLQSDYTKKCQNLAEMQKKIEDKEKNQDFSPEQISMAFEKQSRSFFENNPLAEDYKTQIFNILQEDKLLWQTQNPFEQAWIKYLKNNFVDKKTLIKDPNFLEDYVFNNKEIVNKIIGNYFSQLHTQENPTLISNQKGSKTVLASLSKPTTIEEAGKLVEDLFD